MAPDRHFRDLGLRLYRWIVARRGPGQVEAVAHAATMPPEELWTYLDGWELPDLRRLSDILIAIPATPAELFAPSPAAPPPKTPGGPRRKPARAGDDPRAA